MTDCAIDIRPMLAADVVNVAALERKIFSHPHSEKQIAAMLGATFSGLVVESRGQLLGYTIASFGGGDADLLVIALAEQYRGSGMAERLLKALVKQLQACRTEQLFLEVRESNASAIGFYRKQGFEAVGVRKNYYPLADKQREAALLFKLSLM